MSEHGHEFEEEYEDWLQQLEEREYQEEQQKAAISMIKILMGDSLKMRITSFTFRKGQGALCKLEGIVF